MITAAGVGSGIDIESILSQLNAIDRLPVTALEDRRSELDVELSAYGSVKSALSTFRSSVETLADANDFGAYAASSSDEEVFTATATGGSVPESLDIDVLSLATNHRLSSGSYAGTDSTVGQGTRTFSVGGESFDVTINSENDSLLGLRDSINDNADNTGVLASIINVDGGSRLILTAENSGTEGAISVSGTNSNFSEITEATDANLVVHGFTVTSSSNSISDVVEGVTIDLVGLGTSHLESARDTSSLRASLDEFVAGYNSMAGTLNSLAESQLSGDQLPRGIDTRMREAFRGEIDLGNGETTTTLDLGFTFDEFGTLSINETAYNEALEQGVQRYVNAFATAETGLASKFTDLVDEYTQSGGVIDIREDGVGTRQSSIDDQIERLEYRLEIASDRLRRQYTSMDQIVTNLQTTSSFLSSLTT